MVGDERRSWTLLTSHGHVLVEIARNPRARVRDISTIIGITERSTQSIISDLERAGYVERVRSGRRTHYVLNADNPFRHTAQNGLQVGPFLELLTGMALAGEMGGGLRAGGLPTVELSTPGAPNAGSPAALPLPGPELRPGPGPEFGSGPGPELGSGPGPGLS